MGIYMDSKPPTILPMDPHAPHMYYIQHKSNLEDFEKNGFFDGHVWKWGLQNKEMEKIEKIIFFQSLSNCFYVGYNTYGVYVGPLGALWEV